MTDALVHRYVWDEAGFGIDDGVLYARDFGWELRLGTVEDLGIPEAFIP